MMLDEPEGTAACIIRALQAAAPVGRFRELHAHAFQSVCWREARFAAVELATVFRQADRRFVAALDEVRRGAPGALADAVFGRECADGVAPPLRAAGGIRPTLLFATNAKVDELNRDELDRLAGGARAFRARDTVEPLADATGEGDRASQERALRRGQEVVRATRELRSPYFWGAFQATPS